MPKFDVSLLHTLEFTGNITVTAKDEESAEAKVQKLLDDLMTSPIAFTILDKKRDWECVSDETTINEITET
jgi:hypothetical protein